MFGEYTGIYLVSVLSYVKIALLGNFYLTYYGKILNLLKNRWNTY